MQNRIYFIFQFSIYILPLLSLVNSTEVLDCQTLNEIFKEVANNYGQDKACQCYERPSLSSEIGDSPDEPWVCCSSTTMPQIFREMLNLNQTYFSKMMIWDAQIAIIPSDMFAHVRPRILSIESSSLSLFRAGAFKNIGPSLKSLHLRRNILREIQIHTFTHLNLLKELDLSFNKLEALKLGEFDPLKSLETLVIANNQIVDIHAGTFVKLKALKTLNLAHNRITSIEKDTFEGLDNLESLDLQFNNIELVHPEAFSHMKKLKVLNLGDNQIGALDIHGIRSLEKLYLHNNDFNSLSIINIDDLSALKVLVLDNNRIKKVSNSDLRSLKDSPRLDSLSLAGNEIEIIEDRAFEPVNQITKLSLQQNLLPSLMSKNSTNQLSFLNPLIRLTHLYLSNNRIIRVGKDNFNSLISLNTLALDHNFIEKIDERAFLDLPLKKVYLNHNDLSILPRNSISSIFRTLRIIDISENPLKCSCAEQWLSNWLNGPKRNVLNEGSKQCIESQDCSNFDNRGKNGHSMKRTPMWANVMAFSLFLSITLILITCGILIKNNFNRRNLFIDKIPHILGKVPIVGFFVRKVSSLFTTDKPTVGVKTFYSPASLSQRQPLISNLKPFSSNKDYPTMKMLPLGESEKKRVRFNDG